MIYKLLGNSGLRVSEFALGTMTFGNDWGWGAAKDESHKVYNAFRDSGGNFVDTNAVGNGLCITNGGQFISSVAVTVGTSVGCNSNWVYVGGSPGPGTNALLNLGTKAVTIGNDATATGNWMTVASGGIFTNGTIVLGGVGSVAIAAIWSRLFPALRDRDRLV